jgi:hypothetical protein
MFTAKMPPTRVSPATIRPLRYELAGGCLPLYARSHSCRSVLVQPSAPSRQCAAVPPSIVSKSVANPGSNRTTCACSFRRVLTDNLRYPSFSWLLAGFRLSHILLARAHYTSVPCGKSNGRDALSTHCDSIE